MIKIEYDPVDGKIVADAEAYIFMEKLITKKKPKSIEVGNYTMIMAVRDMIKSGLISKKDVEIIAKGQIIRIDDDGSFLDYPNEFDEVHESLGFRKFISTCDNDNSAI